MVNKKSISKKVKAAVKKVASKKVAAKKRTAVKKCNHKICGVCGGIKRKNIGSLLSDVCSPQCLAASKDACECKCGGQYHRGQNSKKLTERITPAKKTVQTKLFGLSGLFDTTVIKDIDSLKKQYFKLAKKYHPDAGGTTVQFQELQKEYEKLLAAILKGSTFTQEQKDNEIELDKQMRIIIDILAGFEDVQIELIGKWLWMTGDSLWSKTIRPAIKQAGAEPRKKNNVWYFVYKGVESKSRGGMDINDIRSKYGSEKIDVKSFKKLSGITGRNITPAKKAKLKTALKKLFLSLNKRPI